MPILPHTFLFVDIVRALELLRQAGHPFSLLKQNLSPDILISATAQT